MAVITFKGNTVHTLGELPKIGETAPAFHATDNELNDVSLKKYLGKNIILNIFPSVDTSVCANTIRRFNELAEQFPGVVILCISADLPFAQQPFLAAEPLKNVVLLSVFRYPEFGKAYGIIQTDGPLQGLLARAVVAINQQGDVIYTELVKEIGDGPNYSGMITALQKSGFVSS